MNYYISDTHFGHENIVKHDAVGGARKFSSIEEHDNLIIQNWNNVVTPQDNIYILGDFSWLYARETENIIKKLNGSKFLIKGNHDRWCKDGTCKKLFQGIYDYKSIVDNGRAVVMSHYPIYAWPGQPRGAIHLYGHVHNNMDNKLYQKAMIELNNAFKIRDGEKYKPFAAINVGCMLPYMDYTPRTLDELMDQIVI